MNLRYIASILVVIIVLAGCVQPQAQQPTPIPVPTDTATAVVAETELPPQEEPSLDTDASAVSTIGAEPLDLSPIVAQPTGDTEPTPEEDTVPAYEPDVAAPEPIPGTIPPTVLEADMPSDNYTFASFDVTTPLQSGQVNQETIAEDLENVEVSVLLAPEQRQRLADIGFVVSPGETKEFYELYEKARYDYVPIFVTSDSLLHVYHLLFDKTLRRTETEFLIPLLSRLDWQLLTTSIEQYETLRGTPWSEAARRNAAYFAVAVKLLNPGWQIPEGLQDLTDPDLASIATHNGIAPSAIFPAYPEGEDWSQYVPRGHYTRSDELKRYFLAMMWHGRMTFRVDDRTETRQAALLTQALRDTTVRDQPALNIWHAIYDPTVFFVGRSDDLTPQEYGQALDVAYGQVNVLADLLNDANFKIFQEMAADLRAPEILGMVISRDEPDVEDTTKGLRFMGQRFVPDAFIFRQLVDRNVPDRMLPKALDVFATLGSDRALMHLEGSGDTAMENYLPNMTKLRDQFAAYDEQVWTQNLYWSWIYTLLPLLDPVDTGYPSFMRSEAWLDKQLTTALGSWTQLKRDTILYAKQVYVEKGAGPLPPPEPEPPKGYVEPVPMIYARIAALAHMTIDGLEERGMLLEDDKRPLEDMIEIANQLQTIAEKELQGQSLTEDEYRFIRFYGADIEGLTFAADDDAIYYGGASGTPTGGDDLQVAVVADVATDPNGAVLEEGVGRVFDIYVVAPIEDQLVLTKGGVFSHYEFSQPLSNRLTDEAWRAMLDRGEAPPLASWTASYLVEETTEQELAETIRQFNDLLVEAFWFTDVELVAPMLGDEELADTRAYIEDELVAQDEFLGMKRYSLQFLSFDFEDANHAIVTTRERWSETYYSGSPFEPGSEEELRTREPYDMVVTYTLERRGDRWIIMSVVTQT